MHRRQAITYQRPKPLAFTCVCLLAVSLFGCAPELQPPDGKILPGYQVGLPNIAKSNQVLAQGRLQPEHGIIKISGLPGDRIDKILVQPGQTIQTGQALVVLQSETVRRLELQTAQLKVVEAKSLLQVKRQEADLAIDAANLKSEAARQAKSQSGEQQKIAKKSTEQLASLQSQIDKLEDMRSNPLTRAAIGSIELESKKNELAKAKLLNEQSLLAADQAFKLSDLQVSQSQKAVSAAEQSRALVDSATPVASLESQIELLKLQHEQSQVVSQFDGVVISVNVEVGERTSVVPMLEVADLSSMICIAEVHESDAARVAVDDRAELTSSALGQKLRGRVLRIDRVVGAAQMRSANPMARSDFRSIPVWIAIDKDDTEAAAERLQLQVDVSINTTR